MKIIALDPGKGKIGYAIFNGDKVVEKGIFLLDRLADFMIKFKEMERIVLGRGTGWKAIYKFLEEKGLKEKVVLIEERGTTEEAKRRYFEEEKKKGLIWLVRKWLNLPDRPLDDLSAQIIGERFLKTID
jgi:RNase H-fold protein (predicted Holliday junction resolvase)